MAKLKYGVAPGQGEPNFTTKGAFLASDVLSAKSGRYVVYDISDGYWRALNDGENAIGGYVEQALTCNSTNGNTVLPIATNVDGFSTELPYSFNGAAATLTDAVGKTLINKLIDIYVAANIQYADNRDTVADSIFRVTAYDVDENTLTVTVVNSKINQIA